MVLRANTGSSLAGDHNRVSSCTLLLRYIKPHDDFSPPDLTVELDNPQVLLLFRCGFNCLLQGNESCPQHDVSAVQACMYRCMSVSVLLHTLLHLRGACCRRKM